MKIRNSIVVRLLATSPAFAGVLYDNGRYDGNFAGWGIFSGQAISDSFTLSSPSVVGGFDFVSWAQPGDPVSGIDWSITDVPGGTVFGSASGAAVSSALLCAPSPTCGLGSWEIDESTVAGLSVSLAAGTFIT